MLDLTTYFEYMYISSEGMTQIPYFMVLMEICRKISYRFLDIPIEIIFLMYSGYLYSIWYYFKEKGGNILNTVFREVDILYNNLLDKEKLWDFIFY